MATALADLVRIAAEQGRQWAEAFPERVSKDDLPWKVVAEFDAAVRGHIERDPQIENERDRVLIAAVTLAEAPADTDCDEARGRLVEAIDFLEQSVLRFGIVNRKAARSGYGAEGDPVSTRG